MCGVDSVLYNRRGNNQKPPWRWNVGTPNTIFSLLYTFQFYACYIRKGFIRKFLSFHHFHGLSMSVDNGYVRMSSCWQLWYDLERRGRMSLGQMLFEFLLPRMQEQHMLPASDTVSGSLGHSAEHCAFLTFCFKYSSFDCVLTPSQTARLNEVVANLPWQCVFIHSPQR